MLTRKQQWRRAHVNHRQTNKTLELLVNKPLRSPSRSMKSENLVSLARCPGESRNTLLPHVPFPVCQKFDKYDSSVRFSSCVEVILIPSREEFESASDLFWTLEEISSFRSKAMAEIMSYAAVKAVSFEEAREALYQPGCEDPDSVSSAIVCKLRRDSVQVFSALEA